MESSTQFESKPRCDLAAQTECSAHYFTPSQLRICSNNRSRYISDTVAQLATLTFEEMCTFLAQVEAALNSRPLSALNSDSGDANVLTPGHFITGQPLTAVPEPNIVDEKVPAAQRWRLVQQMTQHFWRRWSREYLHQLQERNKWQTAYKNIMVGDVIVLHDETKHCTQWRMGRVVDAHPGADGLVRVVSVKTSSGIVKRSVTKVSRLPVHRDDV